MFRLTLLSLFVVALQVFPSVYLSSSLPPSPANNDRNCTDFDLCENCEKTTSHDPSHVFIQIRTPLPDVYADMHAPLLSTNVYSQSGPAPTTTAPSPPPPTILPFACKVAARPPKPKPTPVRACRVAAPFNPRPSSAASPGSWPSVQVGNRSSK